MARKRALIRQPRTYVSTVPFQYDDGKGTKITADTIVVKHNGRLCNNRELGWHKLGSQPETCNDCFIVT